MQKQAVKHENNTKIPQDDVLFNFGLISDIQYGDLPNGTNYSKTISRYYRDALKKLDDSIQFWNDLETKPEFVLQLGDLIDGYNHQAGLSDSALASIKTSLSKSNSRFHNILGNHELINFSRKDLISSGLFDTDNSRESVYYDFTLSSRYRFVVLDCFEISLLGLEESDENYKEAFDILKRENPNPDWNGADNMESLKRRFVKYNGALSRKQLAWLEDVLDDADQKGQFVIIAGHPPILPEEFSNGNLCWNYAKVLSIMHNHRSVCLYLCGHIHVYNHVIDDHGVHHLSMPGVVETPPGTAAFGTVYCYSDRVEIVGEGTVPNLSIDLKQR